MKPNIKFSELHGLLLDMGFRERAAPTEIIFWHESSDTIFAFRRYRPRDRVAAHDVIEVKTMLESRGLMSPDDFAEAVEDIALANAIRKGRLSKMTTRQKVFKRLR